MDLNISEWKEFQVGKLFSNIYKAKAHTKEEVSESNDGLHFVSRTDENNGIDINVEDTEYDGIEEGNCITIGDTTATVFYQDNRFITGDHMVVLRASWLNQLRGLFFRTLFSKETIRYCYGRAYRMDLIKETILKLPIQRDEKLEPIFDDEKQFSDEGYIPDWNFMEKYILSLKSKPILTKNRKASNTNLNVEKWEDFKVEELFSLVHGKANDGMLEDGDDCVYLGAKLNDCGFMRKCKYNPELSHEGNCICFVTNGEGSVGYAFYKGKEEPFIATIDLVMGYADFLNPKIGVFISTCLCLERKKYSHGRKWKKTLPTTVIRLPIQRNPDGSAIMDEMKKYSANGFIPDWDFMEKYITSLPYSDRICI